MYIFIYDIYIYIQCIKYPCRPNISNIATQYFLGIWEIQWGWVSESHFKMFCHPFLLSIENWPSIFCLKYPMKAYVEGRAIPFISHSLIWPHLPVFIASYMKYIGKYVYSIYQYKLYNIHGTKFAKTWSNATCTSNIFILCTLIIILVYIEITNKWYYSIVWQTYRHADRHLSDRHYL